MTLELIEQRRMIDRLMNREGGFVDRPLDRGGPTNHGIALATLEAARGYPVSAGDVRALGKDEAADIYQRLWFNHSRLQLAEWPYRRLAEVTLDAAVMFSLGRSMAVKWVQEACNRRMKMPGSIPLAVDGWAGIKTQFAMARHEEAALVGDVIGARLLKHARVVAADPDQAAFLVGWSNRAVGWLWK